MKLVSVVTPVYKAEQYIAAMIQSVLDQSYQNFELLLIDDGSPDRSIEVARQFNDPRIKIIAQENRGAAGARNTGLRHVRGEYIAFLDADDLWLPQKLEKHISHLEKNPEIGITFSSSAFIDAAGNLLGIYQFPKNFEDISTRDIVCRNPIGNGSTAVVRREAIAKIKFQDDPYGTVEDFYYDESLSPSEDVEFWVRIAVQTDYKIKGIPEPLTQYRIYSGGTSANLLKKDNSWEKMIEKIRIYEPKLMAQCEHPVRAYHQRYLARRAVSMGDGRTAVKFAHQAIASYKPIAIEEPLRTAITLAAAYSLVLLPPSWYQRLEATAMKFRGGRQKDKLQYKQQ